MEVRPGYKQTEVGVVPDDWTVKPVWACGDVVTGGTPPTLERSYWHGEYPWVTPTDISTQRDIYTSERCISSSGLKTLRALPANSVLVTCIASIGKNAVLKANGACNQQINAVVPNRDHVPEFLYYVFENSKSYLLANAGITATNILPKSAFKNLLLPLPPTRAEEASIALALGDADSMIDTLEQLLVKKRQLKQGAMQELLTRKKHLPGFSGAWDAKALGQVAPLQRGFDLPHGALRRGPFPVVYSNGVLTYHVAFQVKGPGVVTGRSGTIGNVTFVEQDFWPHNTALWVTSFKGNDPKFVFYLLTQAHLERFASGSGVPTLNRNDVHAFTIGIPTDSGEQVAIATILTDMDAEITTLEGKLTKARQLKQGMMQELLTGRIRLV